MDFQTARKWLDSARSVLMTTHVRPDGDAVGSVMALARTLDQVRSRAGQPVEIQPVFLSEVPAIYRFLLDGWEDRILEISSDEAVLNPKRLDYFDRVVVLDTHAGVQLPSMADYLRGRGSGVIVFDHHRAGESWGHCRLLDPGASATGELVYRFLEDARWPVDSSAAGALFAAIATDTGWFRFESAGAATFETAARLIEAGAEPGELYRRLFESFPAQRILLAREVLATLELHYDNRLAFQCVTQAMLAETHAQRWQSENLVNRPMEARDVAVSVLLTELEENKGTRVSLRSRYGVDVNEIARRLGGGGHEQAAGATLKMPMGQAREKVIQEIGQELA